MAEMMLHPSLASAVMRAGAGAAVERETDAWLGRQAEAARRFGQLGLPSRKGEAYRYANLRPLLERPFAYDEAPCAPTQPPQTLFQCDLPRLDAYTVFLVNGIVYADGGLGCRTLPSGAVYGSARSAMASHAHLFTGLPPASQTDGLAALAQGLARDGYFIYVPDGVHLDKPIQVVSLLQGPEDRLVASRSAILMGRGARAQVVICSHTLSAAAFWDNAHLACHLAEAARLDLTAMQNAHDGAAQIFHLDARVAGHAVLRAKTLTIHGGFTRSNIAIALEDAQAECHLGGMALIDGHQYADTQTTVQHLAPSCHSTQLYKNLVDGHAESAFYGIIHVHPDAQLTTAYQRAASIMLTAQAAVHARPQLIIHADDVKCSHGATVGQLDDNARFYLRSRGIAAADVDRMLMNAFVGDVLRDISLLPLKERMESIVEKRLRGERDRCHAGCSALV